jgi:hypothetical protein
MMDDSSHFAVSDSDKHDWVALMCCIPIPIPIPKGADFNYYASVDDNTTVCRVPVGCDFTAARSCHAVMADRNTKLKWILVNYKVTVQLSQQRTLCDLSVLLLSRCTMMHLVLLRNWKLLCSVLRGTCKGRYTKMHEANKHK